jgi:hypothetical protein
MAGIGLRPEHAYADQRPVQASICIDADRGEAPPVYNHPVPRNLLDQACGIAVVVATRVSQRIPLLQGRCQPSASYIALVQRVRGLRRAFDQRILVVDTGQVAAARWRRGVGGRQASAGLA